jgi:hypothetical protein
LGQLAQQHQAHEAGDQDAVAKALQEQNQEIAGSKAEGPKGEGKEGGQFPELSEPHLLIASPAGIESTTAQSTHQHSGQHHAISSGGHPSVSSGKRWLVSANEAIRMFSYKMGVKLVSAACDVEFKAMDASINLLAKLKITAIKPYPARVGIRNQLLLKIETDQGISGWGESGLTGREKAVVGAIEHYREFLIGQDAMQIGRIWQEMYRSQYFEGGRVLQAAISAIDIALHDIKGKALGVPVYDLLGGKQRDVVPTFASTGAQTTSSFPAAAAFKILRAKSEGSRPFAVVSSILAYFPPCPVRAFSDKSVLMYPGKITVTGMDSAESSARRESK